MNRNAPHRGGDRRETATYIADLSVDLIAMARQHNLSTLCYLLEMARLEAERISRPEATNGT